MGLPIASITLWLGIYSTLVSTAVALLTLYAEVFLRIKVRTQSGYYGSNMGPAFVERSSDLPATGQALEPCFGINVSNRGRQAVYVARIQQARSFEEHRSLDWIATPYSGPDYVQPNSTLRFIVGGAWTPQTAKARRFFVVDGVGIVHPLHERWRMRAENLLFRKALLRLTRR